MRKMYPHDEQCLCWNCIEDKVALPPGTELTRSQIETATVLVSRRRRGLSEDQIRSGACLYCSGRIAASVIDLFVRFYCNDDFSITVGPRLGALRGRGRSLEAITQWLVEELPKLGRAVATDNPNPAST